MPLPSPSRRTIALATAAACLAATVAGSADASPKTANITRVTVGMVEYKFHLSRNRVPKGTVVFTVVNKGELAHIFEIPSLHKITPLLQPGKRSTLRVTFRKPGRYYYICPVGAHVQFGMAGKLRVTA
jgi:plastocyanin